MFDIDKWQEILETISKNKLRTALTAFSVSWGIFMLMLLLGFGKGLQNGTTESFAGDATNSLWFDAGTTTLGYNGLQPGRKIKFENSDRDMIASIPSAQEASSRNMTWAATITYKNNSTAFSVMWIHPNYRYLEQLSVKSGRFLNEDDYVHARKVVSIGSDAVGMLFDKGEDPIGKYITVNGVVFMVVGTFEDPGGDRDNLRLYMPITTGQQAFNDGHYVENMSMLVDANDEAGSKRLEDKITKMLKEKYSVAPADERAIRVFNSLENYQQIMGIFTIIDLIVWVVGIMTLLAGIIGVANIMLITVKERTREIGIRKAMGATPGSILGMIMQESILITVVSGYMGLVLGVLVLEQGWLLKLLASMGIDTEFIKNPSVDFSTAISATIVLIVAGSLAGLIPAVRAANINPMKAIRDE